MSISNPVITEISISFGAQGTLETLRIMAGLSRKAATWEPFREFASMFSNASDANSVLRTRFTYVNEDVETLYAPEFNLAWLHEHGEIIGDCDDIAMFYGAIFLCLGIPSRFVAMRTRQFDPDFYHVVVEAWEDGRWKRFDPTVVPSLRQVDYGQLIEVL